jgi:hypothetical protein
MNDTSAHLRSLLDRLKQAQHAVIEGAGPAAWTTLNRHDPQDRGPRKTRLLPFWR